MDIQDFTIFPEPNCVASPKKNIFPMPVFQNDPNLFFMPHDLALGTANQFPLHHYATHLTENVLPDDGQFDLLRYFAQEWQIQDTTYGISPEEFARYIPQLVDIFEFLPVEQPLQPCALRYEYQLGQSQLGNVHFSYQHNFNQQNLSHTAGIDMVRILSIYPDNQSPSPPSNDDEDRLPFPHNTATNLVFESSSSSLRNDIIPTPDAVSSEEAISNETFRPCGIYQHKCMKPRAIKRRAESEQDKAHNPPVTKCKRQKGDSCYHCCLSKVTCNPADDPQECSRCAKSNQPCSWRHDFERRFQKRANRDEQKLYQEKKEAMKLSDYKVPTADEKTEYLSATVELFRDIIDSPSSSSAFILKLGELRGRLASDATVHWMSELGKKDEIQTAIDFQFAATEPVMIYAHELISDDVIREHFVGKSIENADVVGKDTGTSLIESCTRDAILSGDSTTKQSLCVLLLSFLFNLCDFEVVGCLEECPHGSEAFNQLFKKAIRVATSLLLKTSGLIMKNPSQKAKDANNKLFNDVHNVFDTYISIALHGWKQILTRPESTDGLSITPYMYILEKAAGPKDNEKNSIGSSISFPDCERCQRLQSKLTTSPTRRRVIDAAVCSKHLERVRECLSKQQTTRYKSPMEYTDQYEGRVYEVPEDWSSLVKTLNATQGHDQNATPESTPESREDLIQRCHEYAGDEVLTVSPMSSQGTGNELSYTYSSEQAMIGKTLFKVNVEICHR